MKLNLGCGWDKLEGYINCDISPEVKPNKIINLEEKLHFEDNSIDEILLNHVLEHIKNFIGLIHELYRISKVGAIIKIKCPFYSSWGQFNDPTHIRFFTPFTFEYFRDNIYSHEVKSKVDMFDVKVKINYRSKHSNPTINKLINLNHRIYCRLFAWIFPASEIEYELIVKEKLNYRRKQK